MKRSTIERGAFTMSDDREYVSDVMQPNKSDRFERPTDNTLGKRSLTYEYIGDNGLPVCGTYMPGGSVVIGKTVRRRVR